MTKGTILLASKSPVRRTLLARAGVSFAVEDSAVDESEVKANFFASAQGETNYAALLDSAKGAAAELAWLKAVRVAQRFPTARVIAADQIFISSKHREPLSKPRDLQEAKEQLRGLSGAEATLITAAIVVRGEDDGTPTRLWGVIETPRAVFRDFSAAEADVVWRLQGEDSLHAAGSCCLEGAGVRLLAQLDGDAFTFLGLPLIALLNFLRIEGLD